jgi:hypothetical protein
MVDETRKRKNRKKGVAFWSYPVAFIFLANSRPYS